MRPEQFGRTAAESLAEIVHVALEQCEGIVVAGGIDGLRQVDDHRPGGIHQHVELREVAVNDACAEHQHHLRQHEGMPFARLLRRDVDVTQPWRDAALGIADQFHQQHAVEHAIGFGNAHAGAVQLEERIDLGIFPLRLGQFAAVAAAALQRARVAAAAGLAAFLVFGEPVEAALGGVLVDLGAAYFLAAGHHEHGGFLAAAQAAHDGIDDSVFDQGLQLARRLHCLEKASTTLPGCPPSTANPDPTITMPSATMGPNALIDPPTAFTPLTVSNSRLVSNDQRRLPFAMATACSTPSEVPCSTTPGNAVVAEL